MSHKNQPSFPLVSIIIPHIGPWEILSSCLQSLSKSSYPNLEVFIVNNGQDISPDLMKKIELKIIYIKNRKNLGFAGGCNVGIKAANGAYIVLLNNDTTVEIDWLEPLVKVMESDSKIAACQPRLLSSRYEGKLDYAGAMGGLIDIFGFPFAIGRIFKVTEPDDNRYSGQYNIFWASGTASIWRRSIFEEIGYLDEDFFAHMEEIDLNWRCHLTGYKVCSVSGSRVYHYSGYSLDAKNWQKMYLNHRNNLVMLIKNYETKSLLWLLPLRLLFEMFAAGVSFFSLNWKRLFAVFLSLLYVVFHLIPIWKKHISIQELRNVEDRHIFDRMYRGSVVWQYYILRNFSVSQFMEIHSVD